MGVRLLVVLLLRRILLLAVWVVVGRRSASWLSSVATAIHHHLLLLLLLLQDSPVLPVEHLYGLLVRQEGRIGMELLQEDDSPGLRDVQAVHGLKVCRQAQKCGVRQHDGSFSTGYSPEPPKYLHHCASFVFVLLISGDASPGNFPGNVHNSLSLRWRRRFTGGSKVRGPLHRVSTHQA